MINIKDKFVDKSIMDIKSTVTSNQQNLRFSMNIFDKKDKSMDLNQGRKERHR